LTSLQQQLVKTGGRLVKHPRYYWLMLAEGHLTRTQLSAMVRRIAMFPIPANQRLTAMPVNRIVEDKGGGNSACKIGEEDSRLRGRVQEGTESLCFSTANVVLAS
jgi:hypothetical protein